MCTAQWNPIFKNRDSSILQPAQKTFTEFNFAKTTIFFFQVFQEHTTGYRSSFVKGNVLSTNPRIGCTATSPLPSYRKCLFSKITNQAFIFFSPRDLPAINRNILSKATTSVLLNVQTLTLPLSPRYSYSFPEVYRSPFSTAFIKG